MNNNLKRETIKDGIFKIPLFFLIFQNIKKNANIKSVLIILYIILTLNYKYLNQCLI